MAAPGAPFKRQQQPDQLPFRIRQVPTAHVCSPKSSLELELPTLGSLFRQHRLDSRSRLMNDYLASRWPLCTWVAQIFNSNANFQNRMIEMLRRNH